MLRGAVLVGIAPALQRDAGGVSGGARMRCVHLMALASANCQPPTATQGRTCAPVAMPICAPKAMLLLATAHWKPAVAGAGTSEPSSSR